MLNTLPIYLLRQIYYFLLERPEINKKSNLEKIQDFFFELGVNSKVDARLGIRFHTSSQEKRFIDPFDVPNFLNENEFIQWVTKLLYTKK